VVERARTDYQPALIELLTYRFRGHSMSDPAKYRTKEEVDMQKDVDPLHRCELDLRQRFGLDDAALEQIDDEIVEAMHKAVEFADASTPPDPEFRFKHHYVEDD
jgi:pyruvate dehydrogenase E1 component alpha subunit